MKFLRSVIIESNDSREFQQSIRSVVESWQYLDRDPVDVHVQYATRGVSGYSALVTATQR